MRVDLPLNGIVGKGTSLNSNPAESLNCYIEINALGQPIAIKRPGQKLAFTLPNSPVRGCYSDSSISYWVAGNGVYKRTADNVITTLGAVNSFNGSVNFASSGQKIIFVDGDKGYEITTATDVLVQITDVSFPAMPVDVSYLGGLFVVTTKGTQQYYWRLAAATTWNALDFASAEGNPDNILAQEVLNDELYLLGYKTIEVASLTGNGASPLQRNRNVIIDHGCIAANSPGKAMDALYWLGGDNLGYGIVWRVSGYQPERVSTHEIEQQIRSMVFVEDAFSIVYQWDGHVFYILQFPSEGKTLAFDVSTGLWHSLSYKDPLTGDETIYKASCHCFSGNKNLVGDTGTGKVFEIDKNTYTDDGNPIVMMRTGTVAKNTQSFMFFKELIIDMETGVGNLTGIGSDPVIGLSWSDDAGHNWSNWRYCTIGKTGQYKTVVRFDMLGGARNRVFRVINTDPVKVVILGAVMNVDLGAS